MNFFRADKSNKLRGLSVLGLIWLVGAVGDRIWFALDRSIPAWDQAEYLNGSLHYWEALQHPQWFSGAWWTSFWQLSTKVPPLTYIAAGAIQNIFGTGPDAATLVQLFFSGILLACVYGLGTQFFSVSVGLWAAGLCQLLPGLYRSRLDFLLDYPLTAIVTLSFWCLTIWKARTTVAQASREPRTAAKDKNSSFSPDLIDWLWAAVFGLSLGLALMVKQTALFFLFTPILWVAIGSIRQRAWKRLAQLVTGLLVSVLVFGPWYRTNWLLILTSGKRATVDSAIAEGDPALNTLNAWTYYWKHLPNLVSWPLLLVPIVGFILYWSQQNNFRLGARVKSDDDPKSSSAAARWRSLSEGHSTIQNPKLTWLAVFWVGAYLLSSLNINKDDRYVLPYLPVLSLFLAYGLTFWPRRWGGHIRWGTVALALLLMFLNLFPVGGSLGTSLTQTLSPNAQHFAYLGSEWPHPQVISEIIETEPYLASNLGILPSTGEINQHNFNYYGALRNSQVHARQVGVRQKYVPQDARSLSWFITKTGEQGSVPKEAQSDIVQTVEQESDFQLHKTWNLPDGNILKLYHSRQPPVEVKPSSQPITQVKLERVTVPKQAPPGKPVPVTYEWSGPWEQLQPGLVLLTWRADLPLRSTGENSETAESNNPKSKIQNPKLQDRWLHDHGIGMGYLYPNSLSQIREAKRADTDSFQVIEKIAMLPPAEVKSGNYTLEATYLNRRTGEAYPIPVPLVTLKIDPAASATPAPELDLISQMRTLAATLPKGRSALEPIFEQVGRINQYDPTQDYLIQAAEALEYRLRQEPQNKEWAYALAFSRVLQQQVELAIAALKRVTYLDAQNPYAHAYLAFVYLGGLRPKDAQEALKPAIALNPNLLELHALNGAAALMQGNFIKAWQTFQELKNKNFH
ncbi:MAG: phospholipid carrier-dependent glycosyltransferase [Aphanothece sp. CMT-3BRIN-NPC111]|nr:phospholipid carrier-dependent glycosyltransferase [Aphanothece sp. CMT-3BRIN-NPC111]